MKALIVEDEQEHLALLAILLRRSGFEVFEQKNGQLAWELLQKEKIQLVLTDWMMPGMEGTELIRRIRDANFSHYTYIILLTAKSTKPEMVEGIQSGADDYLTKPFEPDELFARLSIAERILSLESQLRQKSAELQQMATFDAVTGLFNRRAIYESAVHEMERVRRENQFISLAMLDLDHFKRVNDTYGHSVGDQALQMVATIISQHKRSYDWVGRWGGEEFLIVLSNTNLYEAGQIAERLRKTIQDTCLELPGGILVNIQASFGVSSTSQEPGVTFERLVQQADLALYKAKNTGRNRVCLSE